MACSTPGHSKAVISSYLLANDESWLRSVTLSFASALVQSLTAVLIVGFAAVLLGALDEARNAAKAGLALDPGFTIRRLRAAKASDNPTYLAGHERVCMGMCLGGCLRGQGSIPQLIMPRVKRSRLRSRKVDLADASLSHRSARRHRSQGACDD